MKLITSYLKQHKLGITAYFIFVIVFAFAFMLYRLPLKAVIYPASICFLVGILLLVFDMNSVRMKRRKLHEIERLIDIMPDMLPKPQTLDDEDYQEIIHLIFEYQKQRETKLDMRYDEMIDYYTAWAHQIKTPIASMKLHLQNEDSKLSRTLSADLFRIEQYVEMVMMFLRLDSDSTDYLIKKHDLDALIKQCVKRFSGEFIERKIGLSYEPMCKEITTDEKWLSFVIEQLLSNALKYTQKGSISIYLDSEDYLCIEDTGIGIAKEDLPRIFEKGYTGYNGRNDKRASGIGLFLCKRVCNNLHHDIYAESTIGVGTKIKISIKQHGVTE